jgi:Cu(I)/Ag(I) efflux system membrane fusion protein
MYASATIQAELGSSLSIPASAVMRTGEKTYAFRDEGAGKLMPVEIKIGARSGEHFQLLEGLQDGDQVVTSANFLIDSESQLKAALSGMSGHQH